MSYSVLVAWLRPVRGDRYPEKRWRRDWLYQQL